MHWRRSILMLFAGALLLLALSGANAVAQRSGATPQVGVLAAGTPDNAAPLIQALRQGLSERGLVVGKDMELIVRFADAPDELQDAAAELANAAASVLVGASLRQVQALLRASRRQPIVMVAVGDPVAAGLAVSLDQPGGRVTGLSDFRGHFAEARLQLVRELLPDKRRLGFLHNPDAPTARLTIDAAAQKGLELVALPARTPADVDARLAELAARGVDALLVVPYPASFEKRRAIAERAFTQRLPLIFGYADFMDLPGEAAGLASFGTDLADLYRHAAGYVAALLRGASAAELPIRQPEKGELVINLAVARRLGIVVPTSLLRRADRIIH